MNRFEQLYKDTKAIRDALAALERSVDALKLEYIQIEKKLVESEALVKKAKDLEERLAKIAMFLGGGGNA